MPGSFCLKIRIIVHERSGARAEREYANTRRGDAGERRCQNSTTSPYGSLDSDAFTFDGNTGRMTQYQANVGSNYIKGALTWNTNGSLYTLAITDQVTSTNSLCQSKQIQFPDHTPSVVTADAPPVCEEARDAETPAFDCQRRSNEPQWPRPMSGWRPSKRTDARAIGECSDENA